MIQEIPSIIDYIFDFINRLRDFKEWNLEVYIAVLFALIGVLFSAVLTTFKLIGLFWSYCKRKIIENSINPESYPISVIKDATRYYVRPLCTTENSSTNEDQDISGSEVAVDLFKHINKFLNEDFRDRFLILLADSGMGKTSFALNYFANNKSKWLFWKRKRLALVHLASRDATEQINSIERKSETDLILDAFDEDTEAIEDYKLRIEELFDICSNFKHVIITSRTQFFPRDKDIPANTKILRVSVTKLGESKNYDLLKVHLLPFNSKQIKRYLKKRFPYIWNYAKRKKAKKIVEKIPLLSMRPMLLTHIPDLIETKKEISTALHIYEILVEKWIARESYWVDKDKLRKFSEELAVDLYINRQARSSESISRQNLSTMAKEYEIDLSEWQLAGRSLLNRDAIGKYRFSHRSIMEYLFITQFIEGDENCKNKVWTDMMKNFTIDFLFEHSMKVKNRKVEFRSQNAEVKEQKYDSGVVIRFDGIQFNLKGADLSNVNRLAASRYEYGVAVAAGVGLMVPRIKKDNPTILSNIDFSCSNFKNTNLSDVVFVGCNLSNSNFENCKLEQTVFYDCILNEVNLMNCKSFSASFINCNLYKAEIPKMFGVVSVMNTSLADKWTEQVNCVYDSPNDRRKYSSVLDWEV